MEKYKCKLCLRSFSNGRALGGHTRSHMMNLPVPAARTEQASLRTFQLSFEAESASSSSSDDDDNDKALSYRLRENPKRSIRLVDPEFSFAAADTGSVILQDRESETESSKNNPTGRRSKRPWNHNNDNNYYNNKRQQTLDHEPASSVSDATTEEEVAFCLMMLSRDKWKGTKDQTRMEQHQQHFVEDQYEEEEEEDEPFEDDEEFEDSDESLETTKLCKNRGRYKCETCDKVFRSYQALGGHRASHKKIKVNVKAAAMEGEHKKSGPTNCGEVQKKIHECPVCFRIFASGQALGGHKRTHVIGSATATVFVPSSSAKFGNNFIDLNLPAPMDDDDASQIENSAVSDAEFVKTH